MNILFGFRRNDDALTIVEQTREAIDTYSYDYHGNNLTMLKPEHIEALQDGKMLAWNDGEYCSFIVLEQEEKNTIDYFCTVCQRTFKGRLTVQITEKHILVEIDSSCPHCGNAIASGCELIETEKCVFRGAKTIFGLREEH